MKQIIDAPIFDQLMLQRSAQAPRPRPKHRMSAAEQLASRPVNPVRSPRMMPPRHRMSVAEQLSSRPVI